jgi:hypothetical protein
MGSQKRLERKSFVSYISAQALSLQLQGNIALSMVANKRLHRGLAEIRSAFGFM